MLGGLSLVPGSHPVKGEQGLLQLSPMMNTDTHVRAHDEF